MVAARRDPPRRPKSQFGVPSAILQELKRHQAMAIRDTHTFYIGLDHLTLHHSGEVIKIKIDQLNNKGEIFIDSPHTTENHCLIFNQPTVYLKGMDGQSLEIRWESPDNDKKSLWGQYPVLYIRHKEGDLRGYPDQQCATTSPPVNLPKTKETREMSTPEFLGATGLSRLFRQAIYDHDINPARFKQLIDDYAKRLADDQKEQQRLIEIITQTSHIQNMAWSEFTLMLIVFFPESQPTLSLELTPHGWEKASTNIKVKNR